ncbi:hypothetical protein [Primorskyibacter sp. 2E233]|uniref:hypothetical protein n=1 Tax=Primorskyibacter sp. 2E233 TaxID=3413431 RepID=UPI003BF28BD6
MPRLLPLHDGEPLVGVKGGDLGRGDVPLTYDQPDPTSLAEAPGSRPTPPSLGPQKWDEYTRE